jgi:S1-C subfamily serine protease
MACRLALVLFGFGCGAADPPAEVLALEQSVRRATAKAEPAVASIIVSRKKVNNPARDDKESWQALAAPGYVPEYFGSGVVIDHRLVLTCYHVVRDAKTILVRLPPLSDARGREGPPRVGPAKIYAADNRTDLAVLRIERDAFDTPAVELAAGDPPRKGSFVVALTNPFQAGFRETGATVTTGVVSNVRRRLTDSHIDPGKLLPHYGPILQTDTRIPPGGSGGALIDLDGRLVGLTTSLASLAGSDAQGGYAVPVDAGLRRVIDVLRKGEEVEYGFLGVSSGDPDEWHYRRSADAGVMITAVTPNSPAARAGLRPRDVIVRVNGQAVSDFADMYHQINLGLAGRDAELLVQRPGARGPLTVTARLVKAYVPDFGEATNRPGPVHGLRVDYASVIQRSGEMAMAGQPLPDGVVVREVLKDSPAEAAKLIEYSDVINAVNGVPVNAPADFHREAEKALKDNRPLRLTLVNPARTVTLP